MHEGKERDRGAGGGGAPKVGDRSDRSDRTDMSWWDLDGCLSIETQKGKQPYSEPLLPSRAENFLCFPSQHTHQYTVHSNLLNLISKG